MQLYERAHKAYAEQETLRLLDESTLALHGLDANAGQVLVAFLLSFGNQKIARSIAEGLPPGEFARGVRLLVEKNLITLNEHGNADTSPVVQTLRMQIPEERGGEPGAAPSTKLVPKGLRQRVVEIARSGDTPTRGLGRVYAFVFGRSYTQGEAGKFFALMGLYVKELGLTRAALFFLEHANDPLKNPAMELLPLARAEAKGFRPASAPAEEEVQAGFTALALEAWRKRMKTWLREGEPAFPRNREQYWRDMQLWEKKGKPGL